MDHLLIRGILVCLLASTLMIFTMRNSLHQLSKGVVRNGETHWQVCIYAVQNVIASTLLCILAGLAFENGTFFQAYGMVISGTSAFVSVVNVATFFLNRSNFYHFNPPK